LIPEGEQAYILITRSEVGVQKEIYTYRREGNGPTSKGDGREGKEERGDGK